MKERNWNSVYLPPLKARLCPTITACVTLHHPRREEAWKLRAPKVPQEKPHCWEKNCYKTGILLFMPPMELRWLVTLFWENRESKRWERRYESNGGCSPFREALADLLWNFLVCPPLKKNIFSWIHFFESWPNVSFPFVVSSAESQTAVFTPGSKHARWSPGVCQLVLLEHSSSSTKWAEMKKTTLKAWKLTEEYI